jgi:hypothetical protein
MKKIFLLSVGLVLTTLAFAQSDKSAKKSAADVPRFTFGVKGGGSLCNFYSQDFATVIQNTAGGNNRQLTEFVQKALLKPAAGISLTFNFNRYVAFTPEMLIAIVGQENNYKLRFITPTQDTVLQNVKSVTDINYLQIPILFQFSFGKSAIRPYIKLGGTPAYILKGTRNDVTEQQQKTAAGSVTSSNASATQDLIGQRNVSSLQGGATVAVGLHLGRYIDLESRYDFSLSSLSQDANTLYSNAKSQALGVQLGVKFW